MKKLIFLCGILLGEAKKRNFLVKSIVLALIYFVIALFLFEFKLYQSIASQSFPFVEKLKIYVLIMAESFKILGLRDSTLLITIALLFGINLELVLRKLRFLKAQGNLHITIGAGIISLFSAGCAACGLSFASVIGVAGVVSILPFHGLLLYLLSIAILLASLLYNLQTLVRVCKLK